MARGIVEMREGDLGTGVYFTESLDSALLSAGFEDGRCYILLCRVACGQPSGQFDKDSMVVKISVLRPEVVIWQEEQVYPEYILELCTERTGTTQTFEG